MSVEYQMLLWVTVGFIAGIVLAVLLVRSRNSRLIELGKSESKADLAILKERDSEREKVVLSLQQLSNEQKQLISQLETEKGRIDKDLAVAAEKNEQIAEFENKLEKKNQNLEELRHSNANQKATIAELNTRIEEEKSKLEEQRNTLLLAKKELSDQFKTLAQEIFEEKGKKFTEKNQTELASLLSPFREQLKEFRKKVYAVYVNEAKERASLKNELENLQALNKQISQEAINLTRALKGDVKVRGNWGELILERVLEQSGLRKGVEYETQSGFRNGEDHLLKPDVIIHLPEQKDVVVDSKVSPKGI